MYEDDGRVQCHGSTGDGMDAGCGMWDAGCIYVDVGSGNPMIAWDDSIDSG
jgi:hypothetical protein